MQERKNPSSAQDFFAYSIKEKRVKRFSPFDLQSDFEQCGEIASVLIKEKRAKRFFNSRLKK